MIRFATRWLLTLGLLLAPATIRSGFCQDDDDYAPGINAEYSTAGRQIERIDPDIAFVWENESQDTQLSGLPFEARWSCRLLVQQDGAHTFHAFVEGEVTVSLDGREVLAGRRDEPGWISGEPISLDFGEKKLRVTYHRSGRPQRVQLFWSSERFPLEPIPAHLLFQEKVNPSIAQIERGRREFESHRCGRCHPRANEFPGESAPALVHLAAGLRADQIVAKILQTDGESTHARMPNFGMSRADAEAMAAALLADSADVKLDAIPASKEKESDRRAGELLAKTLGCLACHRIGSLGEEGAYGGGELSRIGEKRSAEWLHTWLARPEALNPDHRMPVFELSGRERIQLATYLSQLRGDKSSDDQTPASKLDLDLTSRETIETGRRLLTEARCAACHRLPGKAEQSATVSIAINTHTNVENSCLAKQPDRKRWRPAYANVDRDALRAYLGSFRGDVSWESAFTAGARLFERRNCIACHRRDGAGGLAAVAGSVERTEKELQGQSATLVPPALNAVGDKLLDSALNKAIRGEQKARMPWLRVRMPRFQHTEEEQIALVAYFIGHDRMPDGAPSLNTAAPADRQEQEKQEVAGTQTNSVERNDLLLAGHTLVGAKGFNCLACHQAGRYVPKNTAPATRGSDLLTLGGRMRREYFLRWTRSPLRILPGIEMPSYERPAPGILGENVDRQLAALWGALGDPGFTVPTNPTAVEQFLTVKKGDPARVVHDVFTNPKANGGGNNPRGLAVGLNNGHNLLYDLATFSVRQWAIGDFARQRTEGKSWYWDLAGLPIAAGFSAQPEIALIPRNETDATPIRPTTSQGTCGRLISYAKADGGISLRYDLHFEIAGRSISIRIEETVAPFGIPGAERSGWERRLNVSKIPAGYDVVFLKAAILPLLGEPTIEPFEDPVLHQEAGIGDRSNGDAQTAGISIPVRFKHDSAPSDSPEDTAAALKMRYLCNVSPPAPQPEVQPLPAPDLEPVTTVPGFEGVRLPLSRSIMPTSITRTADGGLAFTSLKGHLFVARDSNGDGIEDQMTPFEEGLAAPFGILADGDDLIVSHKPELLRLVDSDRDGKADRREVIASGWGYTDNYHDWTCGIVRDSTGSLYVGLGSDYTQKKRSKDEALWRGKVLRIDRHGTVTPVGHAFRYPTGLAIDAEDRVFVTDQQGEQNTFNELNLLIPGKHYGVPSRHEEEPDAPETPPTIQIPHPWTRSVNGVSFLPNTPAWGPFAGHAIGCEYDSRFLVRFTLQKVGDVMQGATYYFSRPDAGADTENFLGPLCITADPDGDLYVGSIHDSGWLGGQNTGDVVRLRATGSLPNGIQELRATSDGFELRFFGEIDVDAARKRENYSISAYTREWKGGYHTPDSSRHRVEIRSVDVAEDRKSVRLSVDRLREGFVYEVTAGRIGSERERELFPSTGHYTMWRIPAASDDSPVKTR